jgi:hypothetical protein
MKPGGRRAGEVERQSVMMFQRCFTFMSASILDFSELS